VRVVTECGGLLALALLACAPAANTPMPESSSGTHGNERAVTAAGHAAQEFEGYAALGDDRGGVDLESHLTSADLASAIDGNALATECANHLARAQWRQDIVEVANPAAHFDNCQIEASVTYLRAAYARAESAARAGDTATALGELGRVLHSVLDFYAHTDFVERAAAKWPSENQVVRPALWALAADPLAEWQNPALRSGTVSWEPGNRCHEPSLSHEDLNKDKPDSKRGREVIAAWGVTHYRATANLSKTAALDLVRETLKRPTWATVKDTCGKLYGFGLKFDERKN
jgi:hypothetical protein